MEIRVPGIGWWRRQQEVAAAQLRGEPGPAVEQAAAPVERPEAISEELQARREEIARLEERALAEKRSLEIQHDDLERRVQTLDDRERSLVQQADELKQAKVNFRSSFLENLESGSGFGRADLLAALALYDDDPNRINTILSDLDKVTTAEVQQAAKKYLAPANRTSIDRRPAAGGGR